MTRKHFDKIAWHLAMQEPGINEPQKARLQFDADCQAVADALQATNPRFRKNYFLEACHYEYWQTHKQPR